MIPYPHPLQENPSPQKQEFLTTTCEEPYCPIFVIGKKIWLYQDLVLLVEVHEDAYGEYWYEIAANKYYRQCVREEEFFLPLPPHVTSAVENNSPAESPWVRINSCRKHLKEYTGKAGRIVGWSYTHAYVWLDEIIISVTYNKLQPAGTEGGAA